MEITLSDEDTAALVAIIDAKESKRIRKCNLKKEYYRQDKLTLSYLRNRARELEEELQTLAALPRCTTLSWKELKKALEMEADKSVSSNRALRKRVRELQLVSGMMHRWVSQAIQVSPTGTWCATNLCLNHIRLLAHPEARRHGLDWMTQIMYHNTDAMLQRYGFPERSPYSRLGDVLLDTTNRESLQYVQRYQLEIPMALEDVLPHARSYFQTGASHEELEVHYKMKRYLDTNITSTLSPVMSYDVVIDLTTLSNLGSTRLCRVFFDDNRCVLVTQNVPDDEKLPKRGIESKEMTWVVLERISPTRTIMRCLFLISQGFFQEGELSGSYVPLEYEAQHDWRLALDKVPEADRMTVFTNYVHTLGYRNIQSRDADLARMFRMEI